MAQTVGEQHLDDTGDESPSHAPAKRDRSPETPERHQTYKIYQSRESSSEYETTWRHFASSDDDEQSSPSPSASDNSYGCHPNELADEEVSCVVDKWPEDSGMLDEASDDGEDSTLDDVANIECCNMLGDLPDDESRYQDIESSFLDRDGTSSDDISLQLGYEASIDGSSEPETQDDQDSQLHNPVLSASPKLAADGAGGKFHLSEDDCKENKEKPDHTPKPQSSISRVEVTPTNPVHPLSVEDSADVAASLEQLRDPNAALDHKTLKLVQHFIRATVQERSPHPDKFLIVEPMTLGWEAKHPQHFAYKHNSNSHTNILGALYHWRPVGRWTFISIDLVKKTIGHYDPRGENTDDDGRVAAVNDRILRWLRCLGEDVPSEGFESLVMPGHVQDDTHSSGIFVLDAILRSTLEHTFEKPGPGNRSARLREGCATLLEKFLGRESVEGRGNKCHAEEAGQQVPRQTPAGSHVSPGDVSPELAQIIGSEQKGEKTTSTDDGRVTLKRGLGPVAVNGREGSKRARYEQGNEVEPNTGNKPSSTASASEHQGMGGRPSSQTSQLPTIEKEGGLERSLPDMEGVHEELLRGVREQVLLEMARAAVTDAEKRLEDTRKVLDEAKEKLSHLEDQAGMGT